MKVNSRDGALDARRAGLSNCQLTQLVGLPMPKIADKELCVHPESGDNCCCPVEPDGSTSAPVSSRPCPSVGQQKDFLCICFLSLGFVALLSSPLVFGLINN